MAKVWCKGVEIKDFSFCPSPNISILDLALIIFVFWDKEIGLGFPVDPEVKDIKKSLLFLKYFIFLVINFFFFNLIIFN